jgi:hypothetical protein
MLGLRALLALVLFAVLNLLCWHYAQSLATLLSPLVKLLCNLWSADLDILSTTLQQPKREWLIAIEANNPLALAYPDRMLPAGTPLNSSTLAGHLFQPWIVGLSLLPFLPIHSARRYCLRVVVLTLLLLCILVLDVPLVLLGAIEDVLLHYLDKGNTVTSMLVLWMNFMNGGGRVILPLLAFAVVAVSGTSKLSLGTK